MVRADGLKRILSTLCALNELFFNALYLLSFSSPRFLPSLILVDSGISSKQPQSRAVSSQIWTTPWSAGAMEMAR